MPLTRLIARRNARALFELTAGFVHSQTAAAFIESGLFAALQRKALTEAGAAQAADLPIAGTATLLRAAAGIGLAERIGDHWTLGPRGAMLAGTAGVAEMIAHHRLFYADLADPLALLRGERQGSLADLWSYADRADPAAVAAYSALMAASQPMVAEQAIAAYHFARHRRMLDVGGGLGRFIAAVAPTAPDLAFGLFDRPAVIDAAREALAGNGMVRRIEFHSGSFLTDALPTGYDLVTLVRVLHDHHDAAAMTLLTGVRDALPPGGRLLIVEPMSEMSGAKSVGSYFELYLTAMHAGRPRSLAEIGLMLEAAGFRSWRKRPTPLPLVAQAIVAET